MFKFPARIECEDVVLRKIIYEDTDVLFDLIFSDADTMRYLPIVMHETKADTRRFIGEIIEQCDRGWFWYVAEHKRTGLPAALIMLRRELSRVEIGFIGVLHTRARRPRAAFSAFNAVVDWLFLQPHIFRIYAHCAVHGKSHHLISRLGFTLEATLAFYEPLPNCGIAADDCYLYVKTKMPLLHSPFDSRHLFQIADCLIAR